MIREYNFPKLKETKHPTSEIHEEDKIDISEKRYKKMGKVLAVIIAKISSLSVPEKTISEWEAFSSSTRIIDNKLDSLADPTERLRFTQKIIRFLKEDMADFSTDENADENIERAMLIVKNLTASLEENKRKAFINYLSSILKITEKIKTEKNPRRIVGLIRIEGQIAARLYLCFLPEEFKMSGKFRQLTHAITRLGRVANSLDSFFDLPDDYKKKEIQVPPTFLNRTLFLGAALSDGLSAIKNVGISKDLVKICLRATKQVALDAPKNLK